jgi:thiamine biosynthesis protein ThiS
MGGVGALSLTIMRPAAGCQTSNPRFMIEIVLNGERRSIESGWSVLDLLGDLGIAPERVAVELNESIVRQPEWATRRIPEGAQLEIVQFVGGG